MTAADTAHLRRVLLRLRRKFKDLVWRWQVIESIDAELARLEKAAPKKKRRGKQ